LRVCDNPPEYICICFQEVKSSTWVDNSGIFTKYLDFLDEISLQIGNNQYFPADKFIQYNQQDFRIQAYEEYLKLAKKFTNDPCLTYLEFMNNYPMIIFDVSNHDKYLFRSGCRISINVKVNAKIDIATVAANPNAIPPVEAVQGRTRTFNMYVLYIENVLYQAKLKLPDGLSNLTKIPFKI